VAGGSIAPFFCDRSVRDGSLQEMSSPTRRDDETTRWFDEEFASTIQPARAPDATSFESYLERLEHQDLVVGFRRNRRRPQGD
jgi:hypothetical protein